MNYAIIGKDNSIVNTAIWDGVSEWTPPEEHTLVVPLEEGFGIGDRYESETNTFIKVVGIATT